MSRGFDIVGWLLLLLACFLIGLAVFRYLEALWMP